MKSVLVIDVPMLDDGRHLCNECPIWNNERFFCQYDFNMEAKGCPLRLFPNKIVERGKWISEEYQNGWNAYRKAMEKMQKGGDSNESRMD